MKPLNEDNGLHQWQDDPTWQESVYLSWYDAEARIGGTHRLAIRPNQELSNIWCGVYDGDRAIFRHVAEDIPLDWSRNDENGFAAGPIRLYHDGTSLRLLLEAPDCRVDLRVEDFVGSLKGFDDGGKMQSIHKNHFSLHCGVRGTVTMGGEVREVNGLGWRDHSWGPRRWDTILTHRAVGGNFGPDFQFHSMALLVLGGQIQRRGHVVRNGVIVPMTNFQTVVHLLEDGVTAIGGHVEMAFEDGSEFRFDCTVPQGVFTELEGYIGFYGVGPCLSSDGRSGICNFEVTNNARCGAAPLSAVLRNTLANGYHLRPPE